VQGCARASPQRGCVRARPPRMYGGYNGAVGDTFPHARSKMEQPGFTEVAMRIALTQLFMFFCCSVSRLLSSFRRLSCLAL
jgi:hypothetical protein